MHIIFGYSRNINSELPYSNLTSFDSFKEQVLFSTIGEAEYDSSKHITLYSDRLRSYKNYSELAKKHSIRDILNGTTVSVIQDFIREILNNHKTNILRIKEIIDGRGYPVYQILCSK